MSFVKIVEVGPRDGLQNESAHLSAQIKFKLIEKLVNCQLKYIEVGAFVSERWVPQMANSHKVIEKINKSKILTKNNHYSVLVPNLQGLEKAIHYGIKEVSIFGSCTESFSQKNLNCSISESFKKFKKVMVLAKENKIKVRGYLSMAFGCAYEGKVQHSKTVSLLERMLDLGVYEVSLGDTIGVATPKQVQKVLRLIKKNSSLKKVSLHLHNTRGMALANVLKGLEMGVSVIDSSIGGLGGCPYAKGASGNLPTEELVYMLEGMGVQTGVDLQQLVKTKDWIQKHIGRQLPSQISLDKIKTSYL